MSRKKGFLLAFGLLVTGAVLGALGQEVWHAMRGGPLGRMQRLGPSVAILEIMTKDLGLSGEQRAAMKPVIEEMVAKMEAARQPCREAEGAVMEEYTVKLEQFMTPDQKTRHQAFISRMRDKQGKLMPPGPPPGGPGGPDGPGGPGGPPPGHPPGPPPGK